MPYQAIQAYVEDNDVDLVVMGTHGRTGLERYLLGSVTEKLVRTAPVPVLTVRAPEEAEE
uniref:universal stress protein n=1 Tax=Haloarcula regularis TaxID=3033392 RepID=UPI00387E9FE4